MYTVGVEGGGGDHRAFWPESSFNCLRVLSVLGSCSIAHNRCLFYKVAFTLTEPLCALSNYVNSPYIHHCLFCIEHVIPVRFSHATYNVTEGVGVTYLRIALEVLKDRTFSFKVRVSTQDGSAEGECHVVVYGQRIQDCP